MPTTNIQCGHCGKLMAVSQEFLGQQVRCPHCQQVVVAPSPISPTTNAVTLPEFPAMSPGPTAGVEEESIFTPPESDSAIFGDAAGPRIEMPTEMAGEPPAALPPAVPYSPPDLPAQPEEDPTTTFQEGDQPPTATWQPAIDAAADKTETMTHDQVLSTQVRSSVDAEAETGGLASVIPAPVIQRPADRSGLFVALVVIPLISYSILATIAVLILYFRPAPPDPLEQLPDLEGDFRGATHQRQGAISYDRIRPDSPLPAHLRVGMEQTLRVGDLEVTPRRVELRRLVFRTPGFNAEKGIDDSLVLHLRLRNVSEDVIFGPTDPFFNRRWKPGQSRSNKPYHFLEIGKHIFYGGPVQWRRGQPAQARETIDGQLHQPLRPGQELLTFVCTDPDDHVGKYLADYQGTLLWRVQLRRGFVRVGQREVSATAVIGVVFPESAIERSHES